MASETLQAGIGREDQRPFLLLHAGRGYGQPSLPVTRSSYFPCRPGRIKELHPRINRYDPSRPGADGAVIGLHFSVRAIGNF